MAVSFEAPPAVHRNVRSLSVSRRAAVISTEAIVMNLPIFDTQVECVECSKYFNQEVSWKVGEILAFIHLEVLILAFGNILIIMDIIRCENDFKTKKLLIVYYFHILLPRYRKQTGQIYHSQKSSSLTEQFLCHPYDEIFDDRTLTHCITTRILTAVQPLS